MKNTIRIAPHHSGFFVTRPIDDDHETILAESPRYGDALAAARLLARDMGLDVEAQPDARASMDDQTADALLTVRHHQTTLLTIAGDEVADVFEPILDDALNVVEAALRGISADDLIAGKRAAWRREGGAR